MEQQNLFDLQLDSFTNTYLSESAKWAKFLAIVGFIACGLLALGSLFAGTFMSFFMNSYAGASEGVDMGAIGSGVSIVFTVIMLLVVLLYFFPCLYLYRFATRLQKALRTNDQQMLTSSFASLKSWFKFLGILTIIILAFYALAFLVQIVAFSALT